MEREITPKPSREEEEALDAALARLVSEPEDGRNGWWREGVDENVES